MKIGDKQWLPHVNEEMKEDLIEENNQEIVGSKRNATVRGPGSKNFKSTKTSAVLSKALSDKILKLIDAEVGDYQVNKRNEIVECLIQRIRKQLNINEGIKGDCAAFNSKIVHTLKEYLVGLKNFGGQFSQVEASVDTILTAVSIMSVNDSAITHFVDEACLVCIILR